MVQELSKQEKERLSFETRIYCKNRSIKWLQWNVVARYGKWFVNARDITEIKEVEKIRNYIATLPNNPMMLFTFMIRKEK